VPAFRSDPLDELVIPGGTHVEEHDLVTEGDVIVGGQSTVEFGVRGRNVIAGERVTFGGHIEAEGDCRLDMWCSVADNVLVGEEEKAEEMLSAVLDDGEKRDHEPVLIPRGSRVSDDAWQVSAPGRIGDGCRLHGNVRAESLVVGRDNEIFGSLRAREGITVGSGTEVTGNVTTKNGTVRVGPDANVRGDVSGDYVEVHHEATVEGSIRASEEMSMVSEPVIDDAVVGGSEEAVEAAADHAEQDDATAQADEGEERPEPATAEDGDAAD
jgi:predicted acyltransferase (DUF342 family)